MCSSFAEPGVVVFLVRFEKPEECFRSQWLESLLVSSWFQRGGNF